MKKFHYRYRIRTFKDGVLSYTSYEGTMDAAHIRQVTDRIFQIGDGYIFELAIDEAF